MELKKSHLDYLLKSLLLFAIYFITAKLGLKIDAVSGFATLVWLPTGISLAALLILGLRFWPAVTLGAFLVNLTNGASPLVAAGISTGNTLESLIGAFILNKTNFKMTLDRVQDVLKLIFVAALFSTSISALLGTISLLLGGVIAPSAFPVTWSAWWIGDMISDLIIAPLILVWINRPKFILDPKRILEEIFTLLLLGVIGFIVFSDSLGIDSGSSGRYLVFPPLIWVALRFSQRTSVTAVFLLSAIVVVSTAIGFGYLPKGYISDELFTLQSFMGITAITTMLLSAATLERKELENKKNEFISVVSHELRTPLTSVKIFGQLMQKRFDKLGDKQSAAYLMRMNNQIDKISRLVLELLDVRKIEKGKMELRLEKFNISILIKEIVDEISDTTTRRIIIDKETDSLITADKDRLGQVVTNLISNAMNHSPQNKKIVVSSIKDSRFITVSVQDFGTGIPLKERQNIFNQFYQVKRGAGLGLGLFIAKEIIDRHHGDIWVVSPTVSGKRKIKGSSFYFKIPIERR